MPFLCYGPGTLEKVFQSSQEVNHPGLISATLIGGIGSENVQPPRVLAIRDRPMPAHARKITGFGRAHNLGS
jgi:hypothetical protein